MGLNIHSLAGDLMFWTATGAPVLPRSLCTFRDQLIALFVITNTRRGLVVGGCWWAALDSNHLPPRYRLPPSNHRQFTAARALRLSNLSGLWLTLLGQVTGALVFVSGLAILNPQVLLVISARLHWHPAGAGLDSYHER